MFTMLIQCAVNKLNSSLKYSAVLVLLQHDNSLLLFFFGSFPFRLFLLVFVAFISHTFWSIWPCFVCSIKLFCQSTRCILIQLFTAKPLVPSSYMWKGFEGRLFLHCSSTECEKWPNDPMTQWPEPFWKWQRNIQRASRCTRRWWWRPVLVDGWIGPGECLVESQPFEWLSLLLSILPHPSAVCTQPFSVENSGVYCHRTNRSCQDTAYSYLLKLWQIWTWCHAIVEHHVFHMILIQYWSIWDIIYCGF